MFQSMLRGEALPNRARSPPFSRRTRARMLARPPSATGSLLAADGLTLFTQRWTPDASPRAAVVLVHGYAEHSGRYAHVAAHLNEHGIAVYTYDQRGFGRSEGRRAYVESFDYLLDDLDRVLAHTRGRLDADVPLFLMGHSMGGAVCALYVIEYRPDLAGLILSSPAVEVNPDLAPLLRKVARLLGWIAPTLPTVRTPDGAISRDPAVVEQAANDPLNYHGRVLARTGAEMLRASQRIQNAMHTIRLPLLIFHGTADRLTDPSASTRFYRAAPSSDKTLNRYEGLYHETLNEPEREKVLNDLVGWIETRT